MYIISACKVLILNWNLFARTTHAKLHEVYRLRTIFLKTPHHCFQILTNQSNEKQRSVSRSSQVYLRCRAKKLVLLDAYTYKAYVENEQLPQAFASHLGSGDSYNTRHGTPDVQCRAEGVIYTHALNTKVDDTSAESPGDSFILKGKRLEAGILFPNFGMQFSTEAVVSLFIEYNLYILNWIQWSLLF